jgi:hypothetical protein
VRDRQGSDLRYAIRSTKPPAPSSAGRRGTPTSPSASPRR